MSASLAWLLDAGVPAALGEREMFHLVDAPRLWPVAETPAWASRVLVWSGRPLPVLDLAARLGVAAPMAAPPMVGLVAWQGPAGGPPELGALALARSPGQTRVTPEQARPLPAEPPGWAGLAHACFAYDRRQWPVLDLPRLFAPVD